MAGEGVDGIVGWQVWPSRGFVFIVVDIELSTGGLDSDSTFYFTSVSSLSLQQLTVKVLVLLLYMSRSACRTSAMVTRR